MNKITFLLVMHLILCSTFAFSQITKDDTSKSIGKRIRKSREVKPGTHILGIYAANNQYPVILTGPSVLLQQNASIGFTTLRIYDAIYFHYNYALKRNHFVEAGFKYMQYFNGYETNSWIVEFGRRKDFLSAYATLSFNLGYGYRIITSLNRRLFDVHAGLSFGFTDNKVGSGRETIESFLYTDANNNSGTMTMNTKYTIKNRSYFGFYLGLTKDFRITDNLYISASYYTQRGILSVISEHEFKYSIPTLGVENTVNGILTPRGRMYSLGLRWYFNQ